MHIIEIKTNKKEELINITDLIKKHIDIDSGICLIYSPHTTAAITINENADPDVKTDIIYGLSKLNIDNLDYKHMEGNSPAHIKSSLMGCSSMIPIENRNLKLGTWQGIFFCEFDGPRKRKVIVKTLQG